MITKSIYANGSKGHHRFTLTVQEDSTSGNSSFISYTFKISATNSSWQWRSYNNITYTVSINGTDYTGSIPNFNGNTTTLKSGSNIEIPHNNDGTKTLAIGFNVNDPNTSINYTCGNASASDTMELSLLHKAPVINNYTITELNTYLGSTFDVVEHLSIKNFTISANTYDGATIVKYRIYNGEELLTESLYANFNFNYNEVTLVTTSRNLVKYAVIGIEVEDSLGGITRIYDTSHQAISYNKPNIMQTSTEVKRNGQSTGQVKLNLKGTFTQKRINNINNGVTLSFAYWKKGDTESTTFYTVPSNEVYVANNNVSVSNWVMYKNETLIEDVNPSYVYYFKFKLVDTFNKTSVVTIQCNSGEYLIGRYKDRVDFKKITQQGNTIYGCKTLYESQSGTNGDVTLDDNVANYSFIEIFAMDDNGKKGAYTKIVDPKLNDVIMLSYTRYPSTSYGNTSIDRKQFTVGGVNTGETNKLIVAHSGNVFINSSGAISVNQTQNNIYVYKVVGWL